MRSDVEVVVIGGGAAGIAAARVLISAGIDALLVEARDRLGGRAWTVRDASGWPIDLGCGWLHSADRNPWSDIADFLGHPIDETPPPWDRGALRLGFSTAEQADFRRSMGALYSRLEQAASRKADFPAADLLDPGSRWNPLLNAVHTYISGAELDRISARDLDTYADSGVNWRLPGGYGATIAEFGKDLPVVLKCPVRRIDHAGPRLRLETVHGVITADRAIITLPSTLLANETTEFTPALHEKTEAAAGLPLGLADKLFLALDEAEQFEPETRLFAHTDRVATASYHLRPFGRPLIEAYFGGSLAAQLEEGGEGAFMEFATQELVHVFGSNFARRIKPVQLHHWGSDPHSRGSYSYALPGKALCRAKLAEPVDQRLFFAGEACSTSDFSTAHGAYLTGVAAADHVIAARRTP